MVTPPAGPARTPPTRKMGERIVSNVRHVGDTWHSGTIPIVSSVIASPHGAPSTPRPPTPPAAADAAAKAWHVSSPKWRDEWYTAEQHERRRSQSPKSEPLSPATAAGRCRGAEQW
eukprot:gene33551-52375_t